MVSGSLLTMEMFQTESAYDAELFIDRPLKQFRDFFGADAVVFSIIDSWAKQGLGINTKIRYIIKSTLTNETLFDRSCDLYLDLSDNNYYGGGLVGALANIAVSAINTAVTDHIVAARRCNEFIFEDIPQGKYKPEHLQDQETPAGDQNAKTTVKQ